jgi:hypothetical protein
MNIKLSRPSPRARLGWTVSQERQVEIIHRNGGQDMLSPMTEANAADLLYQARQNFAQSNFDEPSNAFVEQPLIKGEYSQRNSWKKCLQRAMVIMFKVSLTRAFGDLRPGSSALSFTAPSLKVSPNTLRSH